MRSNFFSTCQIVVVDIFPLLFWFVLNRDFCHLPGPITVVAVVVVPTELSVAPDESTVVIGIE